MSLFGSKYEDVRFDLDDGFDKIILQMHVLLGSLDKVRHDRIEESYSDVFKNIEFSSLENKHFLFDDIVAALDLSTEAGWTFGPLEEFSTIYAFIKDDLI